MRDGKEKARVTLNSRGVLLLNKTAHEAFGMPAAVKLWYEQDRRCIGLKPGNARHANSFPVKQKDKWHIRVIHNHFVCQALGIDVRRTVLFIEIDIDREGMMRPELNRTQTIGKTERAVDGKW
jgi:hypothetical protein